MHAMSPTETPIQVLIRRLSNFEPIKYIKFDAKAAEEKLDGDEIIINSKKRLTREEMLDLCKAIGVSHTIKELNFEGVAIDDHGVLNLRDWLKTNTHLSELTLHPIVVGDITTYVALVDCIVETGSKIIFNKLNFKEGYPQKKSGVMSEDEKAKVDDAFRKLVANQASKIVTENIFRQAMSGQTKFDNTVINSSCKELFNTMRAVGLSSEQCKLDAKMLLGALNAQVSMASELAWCKEQLALKSDSKRVSANAASSGLSSSSAAAAAAAAPTAAAIKPPAELKADRKRKADQPKDAISSTATTIVKSDKDEKAAATAVVKPPVPIATHKRQKFNAGAAAAVKSPRHLEFNKAQTPEDAEDIEEIPATPPDLAVLKAHTPPSPPPPSQRQPKLEKADSFRQHQKRLTKSKLALVPAPTVASATAAAVMPKLESPKDKKQTDAVATAALIRRASSNNSVISGGKDNPLTISSGSQTTTPRARVTAAAAAAEPSPPLPSQPKQKSPSQRQSPELQLAQDPNSGLGWAGYQSKKSRRKREQEVLEFERQYALEQDKALDNEQAQPGKLAFAPTPP